MAEKEVEEEAEAEAAAESEAESRKLGEGESKAWKSFSSGVLQQPAYVSFKCKAAGPLFRGHNKLTRQAKQNVCYAYEGHARRHATPSALGQNRVAGEMKLSPPARHSPFRS